MRPQRSASGIRRPFGAEPSRPSEQSFPPSRPPRPSVAMGKKARALLGSPSPKKTRTKSGGNPLGVWASFWFWNDSAFARTFCLAREAKWGQSFEVLGFGRSFPPRTLHWAALRSPRSKFNFEWVKYGNYH